MDQSNATGARVNRVGDVRLFLVVQKKAWLCKGGFRLPYAIVDGLPHGATPWKNASSNDQVLGVIGFRTPIGR